MYFVRLFYKPMSWAFKISLKIFLPITGLALIFGNYHSGLGGYFSLIAAYLLFPFHLLAPVFNYSNSAIFWIAALFSEFFIIFIFLKIIYISLKEKLKSKK